MTVQSPSPGLSGVGGSFSYREPLQDSTGNRRSVDEVGRARGSLVERVVGGAGLEAVVCGEEEVADGAREVVAVAVVAEGGGVVVPLGSKLKWGSVNGKLGPLMRGVYGGVQTNSLVC